MHFPASQFLVIFFVFAFYHSQLSAKIKEIKDKSFKTSKPAALFGVPHKRRGEVSPHRKSLQVNEVTSANRQFSPH